jgi:hypothetical protein
MIAHLVRTACGARALAVLAWVWLVLALPFLTDVGCNFLVALFLAGTWLLLAVAWLVVGLARLPRHLPSRSWWLAAAAGCLGPCLMLTDAGLRARLEVSRPRLEAYAREIPTDTGDCYHEPRWVGLFRLDGTENRGGAVFLYTSHSFLNRHGLAYVPTDDRSRDFSRIRVHPLHGEWCRFDWKF